MASVPSTLYECLERYMYSDIIIIVTCITCTCTCTCI